MKPAGNMSLLRQIARASHARVAGFRYALARYLLQRRRVTIAGPARARGASDVLLWQLAPEIVPHDRLVALSEAGVPDGACIERLQQPTPETASRHDRTWFVQPLFDETGQAVGRLCIHQGCGLSVEVERQLRESDRRFRDFVEVGVRLVLGDRSRSLLQLRVRSVPGRDGTAAGEPPRATTGRLSSRRSR